MQSLRDVEDEAHGEGEHRDARRDAQAPLAGAERTDALDDAAACECEHEERNRDADREGCREEHRADADLSRSSAGSESGDPAEATK